MPTKVIINILLIAAALAAVIVVGKLLGGAFPPILTSGTIVFAVTWLSVFFTAMAGFGPIGTTAKFSVRKAFIVTAVVCLGLSLVLGGVFAGAGALIGTLITLACFHGAL